MSPIRTGQYIRRKRKELGLSQSALAAMLYVEPQTVSKWERGLGMPDYDNLDKLKEIFGCTLTDILECDEAEESAEESSPEGAAEGAAENSSALVAIEYKENEEEKKESYYKFSFFDLLHPKKIKELLEKMFGIEYADTYNSDFLRKDLFKKRSRDDVETTLTQGMFKSRLNRRTLGIAAPWLYMRVLIFLILCTGLSLVPAFFGMIAPLLISAALLSALPLLLFLFESNFARNLSIIDVLKIVVIGGISSILLTLTANILYPESEFVSTVIFAPLVEEFFKALLVTHFIKKIKPDNILTGLLIGFSVGVGFSFFENLEYAIWSLDSVSVILYRSFFDFFAGHHYWTSFFGAMFVFFNQKTGYGFKSMFRWQPLVVLLCSAALHMLWNGSTFAPPVLSIILQAIDCVISVAALITLINIGIAQLRVMDICDDYYNERSAL